jgi:hypothetical protein
LALFALTTDTLLGVATPETLELDVPPEDTPPHAAVNADAAKASAIAAPRSHEFMSTTP